MTLGVAASLAATESPALAAGGARSVVFTQTGSLADSSSKRVTQLQIDAVTGRAYAIDHPSDELVVYDISLASPRALARVPLGSDPVDVAVDPDTHQVYVSDHVDNTVTVVDGHPASPTANTIVGTLSTTGLGGQGIAVDEGSKTLYVANTDSSDLSIIDLGTGSTARVALAGKPDDVVVSSGDHRVYVSSQASRTITPVTGKVAGASVAVAATPTGLSLGAGGLVVSTVDGTENRVALYDSFPTRLNVSAALDSPVASVSSDGTAFLHYVVTTSGRLHALRLDTLTADGDATMLPSALSTATVDPASHRVIGTTSGMSAANLATYEVAASPIIVSLTTSTAAVGVPFTLVAVAVGLPTTMTYSLTGGALPPGLSLASTGEITGTPTTSGTFDFTVSASNGSPTAWAAPYRITVTPAVPTAPVITSAAPPNGTVGVAYPRHQLTASGSPSATFTVSRGSLPPGLNLDERTFEIYGIPAVAGRFEFTIKAENGVGVADSLDYAVVIAPATAVAPTITSGTPTAGTVGTKYSGFTITSSGSPAPRFTVTSGSLPAGLSLDAATGSLAGTPTKAGRFAFTVTATNVAGQDSREYTMVIEAAGPTPTPTPTPTATPTPTVTPTPSATPTPTTPGSTSTPAPPTGTPGGGAGSAGGSASSGGSVAAGSGGRLASTGSVAPAIGTLAGCALLGGGLVVAIGTLRRRHLE
ncbi:putative Ig domain-containing protein [Herbiconiux sp. KACC 21604]|uniref:putative Ig domain-containing protein n=1 Tax=unclassified Herbiconiux TaxID=2618217 RepID=UPI00149149F2|nr:putative Ig domain-containing protein [Herbiconiux sp. SALV-R1]QJU55552.1 beta-propeller fold lactonase family protein [Herbiconiux sp. SALV-R1]WPO86743.1 putative Ig domain-containing protein [Herbiconiux sp. KACC 21604]